MLALAIGRYVWAMLRNAWWAMPLFSGCLGTVKASVGNAFWAGTTSSWNVGSNWSPSVVPTIIASFGSDPITAVTISGFITVKTVQLNSGAPAYSFSITTDPGAGFSITGSGITNSSSNAPTLTVSAGGNLYLTSATATTSAGNAFIINNLGGYTTFDATSTAGTANITNNGGLVAEFPLGARPS
jgi:hypothetical protein